MIKAILFDFDGVLTIDKTGSATTIRYLAETFGIAYEAVKSAYYQFNKRLLLGQTTHSEIWDDFCKLIGRDIPYEGLLDSFRSTRLDDRMIALAQKLQSNYCIGIVTDNKEDRIRTILEYNNIDHIFDSVAISACVHARKDSQKIFESVLSALHVVASECVFIDNSEKNLIVPRQIGMHTILFDDERRDYDALVTALEAIVSI